MATPNRRWDFVPVWGVWFADVIVPAAVFTKFPASDDPDIVQTGWSVLVQERLESGGGKQYPITTLLSQLDNPIPGINLGTIEVPPGSPTVPAPMYAKGVAGGVASLDETAKIPLEQIPDDIGGGVSSWDELSDKPAVIAAGATAAEARDAIGAQPAGSYASGAQGAKADTAVQPAGLTKAAVGLGAVDNTADVDKPVSTAQAAADTAAKARANHTGTQPMSTISDATTVGKAVLGAADAAAARTAIGAGTSSLALGTTGSTAKAGNWTPGVTELPISIPVDVFQASGGTWPSSPAAATQRTVWIGYPGRTDPPATTGRPAAVAGLDSYTLRT